jgi:hypothetical protein
MSAGASHGRSRASSLVSAHLDRVRLDRVPVAVRPWIAACWVLTLAIAVVLLVPGLADEVDVDPDAAARILDRFLAPAWLRMLLLVAAGGFASASAVLALLRHAAGTSDASPLRRELALMVSCFPALALIADRIVVPAVLAGAAFVALELVAHVGRSTRRRAAISGVVAFAAWVVIAVAQLASVANGWTWAVLFGLAAAFAAFGSYYGIQRAAESRTAAVAFLFQPRMPRAAVLAVTLLVVAVVVLRLTVLRELFAEPDPTLWSPFAKEASISWLHAAIVAGLIAAVGAASSRRPLERLGERRIAAGLAAVGNAELVIGALVIVGAFLVAVVLGAAAFPLEWLAWVPVIKVVGVLIVGLLAWLPQLRGTSARALAAITAVYLLPATAQGALLAGGRELPPGIAGFPATPVQVMLLLVVYATGLAVAAFVRPGLASPAFILRLAVVPVIAVHAGWLLPVAWSGVGRWLLVLGIVAALLLFLPPPHADPARRGIDLLAASAAQLLAITITALAIPSLYDDGQFVVLGLLWLSVTVVISLVVETRMRDGARPAAG